MLRRVAIFSACVVVAGFVSKVHAANKIWTAAVNGNFTDAARWTGGVPLAGDTATFNAAGTYTVTFTSSPLNQDLFFQAGTVTFTSSGGPFTYSLNSTGGDDAILSGGSLTLGAGGNTLNLMVGDDLAIRGNASLLAQFGSDITTTDLLLGQGNAPAGDGTLTIDGVGSTLTVNGSAQLGSGGETGTFTMRNSATADFNGVLGLADNTSVASSMGAFNLQSGASITTANIRIAPNTSTATVHSQSGTFSVGTSTVTQDNNATLLIGAAVGTGPTPNTGTLNINTGGVFNTGGGTGTVTVNPTGTINIGGGALNLNGNTTVNGGTINRTTGSLNLAAGRTLTAQNSAQINVGVAELSGGTTWNVNSGARLRSGSELHMGRAGGTTTVTVDGTFSSFDRGSVAGSNAISIWGENGNMAEVTVRNGATAAFGGLHLANSATAGTTGTITVTGNASSFEQGVNLAGADNNLIVGHATGGTGTINVLSGGTFSAGVTTVKQNGRINVDGAAFVSRGNFTLDGGTLDVGAAPAMGVAFDLADGRTMTIQNGGEASFDSDFASGNATINVTGSGSRLAATNPAAFLRISSGGQLSVNSGGDVSAAGPIITGVLGTGTVVVDGAGSTLNSTSGSPSPWADQGIDGATANVTLRNGASASLPGGVDLGAGLSDSDGVFNIESGADATLGPLFLNRFFMDGATATVNLGGEGSTLNATSLTLGNGLNLAGRGQTGGGSATLNVTSGGSFTAANTSLAASGTINITDGIANLGTLSDDGGIINFNSGSLSFTGNLMVGDNGHLADGDLTLDQNLELTLTGTTTVAPTHALILDGGKLTTGTLAVQAGGSFVFNRGTLSVTQSGANINMNIVSNSPSATINISAANVSLGDAGSTLGFHHLGVLNVGANTVTLNSLSYARLGVGTTLQRGAINAPNGIYLPGGGTLIGNGAVHAQITGDAGALIVAQGALSLGDAASPAGFNFDGELRTQQQAVTLNSSSQAALGNLTTLGSGSNAGTLNAANGFVVDFGDAVTGFGTINSDNALAKRAIINGTVRGNSASQPITLTGYVKGVGSFDNVVFAGTFDPGLSPTLMTVGSISFSSTNTLVMELGGTARGSQHDAIIASGSLGLDGALQLALINGFSPAAGNSFDLFDWGSLNGTFDTLQLPALAGGLTWDTSQLYTAGVLAVIAAGLAGDYNQDGSVDAADYVVWRKNDGSQAGYDLWHTNFGRTAASSAANQIAAVPEATSLWLVIAGIGSWAFVRRHFCVSPSRTRS